MNIKQKLEELTPLPLTLMIEYGVFTTMEQYKDPLFRRGLEMLINGEMSRWQYDRFCARHGFLIA